MFTVVISGSKRHKNIVNGKGGFASPVYSDKIVAQKVISTSKQPNKLIVLEV